MKILLITENYSMFGLPRGGAAQRNTLFARALARLGKVEICSFSKEKIVPDIDNCEVVFSKYIPPEKDSFTGRIRLPAITLFPDRPCSYFKKMKEKEKIADDLIGRGEYDLIACRYLHTAIRCGLLKYSDKLVLDIDDNPATKSETMAGYDKSRIQRLKYHYQAKKIPAMVEKTLDKVFCSFYASLIEPPSPKSVYLHNTVVTPAAVPDTRAGASKRILCVGSLFFKPNKNGFCYFANNILPLVRQQIPDAELRIAGNISPKMSEILNAIDGVEAIGFADDLAAEYEAAGVVAIPIYEGSGTCVKFAEAMLMNRPIVSTPVGARGFDEIAKDGVHYLQAKSDEEFAAKTVELLLNAEKAGALTAAAMKTAKENLSEEKFFETVRISIEERLATSSPSI